MQANAKPSTPYELMGGEAAVRQLVDRFYDFMDEMPEAKKLRSMHAKDLGPMRQKLFEFLSGWLGGPGLYFQRSDSKCMGSAHQSFAIDAEVRDQWMICMSRSLSETSLPDGMLHQVEKGLRHMCDALRNH